MTQTEQLIENVCKAIGDLDRHVTNDLKLKEEVEIGGCCEPEEYASLYIRLLSLYDNSDCSVFKRIEDILKTAQSDL